jgi:hypothetical protein
MANSVYSQRKKSTMVDVFVFVNDADLRSELRQKLRNDSQTQLAKKLRISQTQLHQFVHGARPNASDKLLKAMGCKPVRYYQRNGNREK